VAPFRPFLPPQLRVFSRPSSVSPLECALTKNAPVTPLDSALTKTPGVGGLFAPSRHSSLVYRERSSRRATRDCPFVFMILRIPFPATPFLSHPYKTTGGVTCNGLLDPFISVLSVPRWQIQSLSPSPAPQKSSGGASNCAQFWCNVSSFRINTCKSVSKQTTLTPFRINTCEKQGEGGGVPSG